MVFSVCTVCVCVNVRTQRDPVGNWPGLPDGLSHRTIWDSFSGKTTRAGDFKVNGWQVIGWTICLSTNNTVRDKRLDRRTKGTSFFRRANFFPPEPGVSEHFYFWWRERERELKNAVTKSLFSLVSTNSFQLLEKLKPLYNLSPSWTMTFQGQGISPLVVMSPKCCPYLVCPKMRQWLIQVLIVLSHLKYLNILNIYCNRDSFTEGFIDGLDKKNISYFKWAFFPFAAFDELMKN